MLLLACNLSNCLENWLKNDNPFYKYLRTFSIQCDILMYVKYDISKYYE